MLRKIYLLIISVVVVGCNKAPTEREIINSIKEENIDLVESYLKEKHIQDTFFVAGRTPLRVCSEFMNYKKAAISVSCE